MYANEVGATSSDSSLVIDILIARRSCKVLFCSPI